jgi:F-type H+-transporting ATPase subunit b
MKFQMSYFKFQIPANYLPFIACCILFIASPALAAEEGSHSGGSDMVWRIINFAILALALFLALRYLKVKDFFAERKRAIMTGLEGAKKAKEDAEKKAKEFELKFSSLDKRLEEIYQEIKEEGEIEKKRIIEEAIKMAGRIQEQARLAAEQEIKKAKEEIKGEIAKVAVEMAEEILRNEITAADHERLIKEYLEKVRLH